MKNPSVIRYLCQLGFSDTFGEKLENFTKNVWLINIK